MKRPLNLAHRAAFLSVWLNRLGIAHSPYLISEVDWQRRASTKEAVMKALGTGVRGVGWREIEILANARGKPVVLLHGKARLRAQKIGLHELEVSLTHGRELACALVMGSGPSPEPPTDGSAAS